MELVVITSPDRFENEALLLEQFFEEGLELVHFRKPGWSLEQYEAQLRQINPKYFKRIVLHSHYKLMEKYNVKGVHLTRAFLTEMGEDKVKEAMNVAIRRKLSISASVHSLEELKQNQIKYTYVMVSPIFDSISKKDYPSAFQLSELTAFIKTYNRPTKLIALGGISAETISQIKECGFHGAAVLGAIWDASDPLERFKEIYALS